MRLYTPSDFEIINSTALADTTLEEALAADRFATSRLIYRNFKAHRPNTSSSSVRQRLVATVTVALLFKKSNFWVEVSTSREQRSKASFSFKQTSFYKNLRSVDTPSSTASILFLQNKLQRINSIFAISSVQVTNPPVYTYQLVKGINELVKESEDRMSTKCSLTLKRPVQFLKTKFRKLPRIKKKKKKRLVSKL